MKGALRKLLGVKNSPEPRYEDGSKGAAPKLRMATNRGMQPRLNERTITKGAQETNRRDIQGSEPLRLQGSYKQAQGSYASGSRLQGGELSQQLRFASPPKGVTVPKGFGKYEVPGLEFNNPVKKRPMTPKSFKKLKKI